MSDNIGHLSDRLKLAQVRLARLMLVIRVAKIVGLLAGLLAAVGWLVVPAGLALGLGMPVAVLSLVLLADIYFHRTDRRGGDHIPWHNRPDVLPSELMTEIDWLKWLVEYQSRQLAEAVTSS